MDGGIRLLTAYCRLPTAFFARVRRLVTACCLLPTAFFALAVGTAAGGAGAQGLGSIEGQVISGTTGAAPAAPIQVELQISRGGRPLENRAQSTSADGRFRFEGLEMSPDFGYVLTALYQEVVYQSSEVRFAPGEERKSTTLRVFETTRTDPGLTSTRGLLVVREIDRLNQTVLLFEIVTLRNPSDRTFLPESEGGGRPVNLVRFSLPPGAGALHPQLGVEAASVLQVDRGFATSSPFLPGESEVGFTYRVPYGDGSYRFERSVVYNQDELRVLVPRDGIELQAPGLEAAGEVTLASRTYRVYLARNLMAGGRTAFALVGLPPRSPLGALDGVPQPLWAALVVAASIAVATALVRRARSRAPESTDDPSLEGLLSQMAHLDQLGAQEPENEAALSEERRRLKEVAVELMLQRSGSSPVATSREGEGAA